MALRRMREATDGGGKASGVVGDGKRGESSIGKEYKGVAK